MNRKEAERLNHQEHTLRALGFTTEEARALRRISMTLRRWYELECGTDSGYIERDPATDKPYMMTDYGTRRSRWPVADREKGAERRLRAIIEARNERTPPLSVVMLPDRAAPDVLTTYLQTDPRGASLYILRPGDVPEGKDAAAYYTNGICVY